MSNKPFIIDFSQLGGPLYSGRDRGEEVRRRLNLDQIDCSETQVEVVIPESTYSVTSSFFLGLFGDSVRASGNINAFYRKYTFKSPTRMSDKFNDYAERALRDKKPLI